MADFHSKANWFFSNEPVAKDKIDLEFVAIHEITHGIVKRINRDLVRR